MFESDQECIEFMEGIDKQLEELITFLGQDPKRLPRERSIKPEKCLVLLKEPSGAIMRRTKPPKLRLPCIA